MTKTRQRSPKTQGGSTGKVGTAKEPFRAVFVGSRDDYRKMFPKKTPYAAYAARCETADEIGNLLPGVNADSLWFTVDRDGVHVLADAVAKSPFKVRSPSGRKASSSSPAGSYGRLFAQKSGRQPDLAVLGGMLDRVVVPVPKTRMLAGEELAFVLTSPPARRADRFIAGVADPDREVLILTRGNMQSLVVPFSFFRPSPTSEPRFDRLAITDYGQTVKLGDYEAAADTILYFHDPEFRVRTKREEKLDDHFGASVRRLRLRRGLASNDLTGISKDRLLQIEAGDLEPDTRTRNRIAKALQVDPAAIETY